MKTKVMTPIFRVSFPQVFEAKAMPGSEKRKYGLTMLFDVKKMNADKAEAEKWKTMMAIAQQVATEKWPKGVPKNLQSPFRKGEEKEQYQGYGPGIIFISATTTTRPGLVDAKMMKIIDVEDFYAGCFARATVNAYAWSYMGKNGVSFGLQNIQKVSDGEPFGGRSNAEDDFGALEGSIAEDAPTKDVATELFG